MWKVERFQETGIGRCLKALGPVNFEMVSLEAQGVLLSHRAFCNSVALHETQVADSHSLETC